MAQGRMEVGLALFVVVAAAVWTGGMAQTDCTQVIISMAPCLNYIQGNSSTPSSGCCTQLASVVRSDPQCLCQVLDSDSSASMGITINQTQALALPKACNVETPEASKCKGGSPSAVPSADSPTASPDGSVPAGRATNTVPSSDATSTKLAAPLLFFILFVASYASAAL